MKVSLIVTAAGSSRRFWNSTGPKAIRAVGAGPRARPGTGQPRGVAPTKLFATLGDRPILQHTLEAFQGIPQIREILLTLPRGMEKWVRKNLLSRYPGPRVRLVQGGATRAESVWKALQKSSPKNEWVLVHDGARPFPPRKAIVELLKKCRDGDGIILARPVIPTLKRVCRGDPSGRPYILETIDRNGLVEAETPQLVRRSMLIEAYRKNPGAFQATDESSLVEAAGGKMQVLSHSGWNVKVTTPEDLKLAEAYYFRHCEESRSAHFVGGDDEAISKPVDCFGRLRRPRNDERFRIGFGRDTHRLVDGRKFYLGGIRIPFRKGALGHSDGDALLHAVADAILGASGLGDLGEWFPDTSRRYKNMRSEKFLKRILDAVRKKHWRPERVDTVILLEKPKLSPYKARIRKTLARLLGITPEQVSIKAKTLEGLGPEGEGRAVTCEALVTLVRDR